MVQITEEKLLAFEKFLSREKCGKQKAFRAFCDLQDIFAEKSICELLEEQDGAEKILLHFLSKHF